MVFPNKRFKPFIHGSSEVSRSKKNLIFTPSELFLVNSKIGIYLGLPVPQLGPSAVKRLRGLNLHGLRSEPGLKSVDLLDKLVNHALGVLTRGVIALVQLVSELVNGLGLAIELLLHGSNNLLELSHVTDFS